jgi:anti-sigma28 factor (negative regulator of flagellin synthesis)
MTITLRSAVKLLQHPPLESTSRFETERAARVDELRRAILDGTYAVSAAEVADAIIVCASDRPVTS